MGTKKPVGYNDVSPYYILEGAQKLIDLLVEVFGAEKLRFYPMPDGTVAHAEVKIGDSVLMMSDAFGPYPPLKTVTHIYVDDVDKVYERALAAGCEGLQAPKEREGDPDRRGSFLDFAGNRWTIASQK